MGLADGIVREFRSEIISSLVPPSNPPVARNGNKRSNGAYVRHEEYEDSTLIGIRRSPLRAARTVPMMARIFMRVGKIVFRVFLQSEYRFRQSERFPKTFACRKVYFHGTLRPRISKSDCSDSSFMRIAYARYLNSRSDPSMISRVENRVTNLCRQFMELVIDCNGPFTFILSRFFARKRDQDLARSQK